MKKLFWIVGFVTVVWADGICDTKFFKFEKKLVQKYAKDLIDYKKYRLGIEDNGLVCSKKDVKPVLAKVFIHRVIPHWVLVVGKEKGEYLMMDPLTKGEATKLSSYGSYLYSIRVLEKL